MSKCEHNLLCNHLYVHVYSIKNANHEHCNLLKLICLYIVFIHNIKTLKTLKVKHHHNIITDCKVCQQKFFSTNFETLMPGRSRAYNQRQLWF